MGAALAIAARVVMNGAPQPATDQAGRDRELPRMRFERKQPPARVVRPELSRQRLGGFARGRCRGVEHGAGAAGRVPGVAARARRRLHPDGPAERSAVTRPADGVEDVVARRDVALAGHRGDVATVRSALDGRRGRVRATALGALARAGALTRVDWSAPLKTWTSSCAGGSPKRPPPRTCRARGAAVLGLLDDADASVVEAAAWACGELHRSRRAALGATSSIASHG